MNKTKISSLTTLIQHSFDNPSHGNKSIKISKGHPNWKITYMSLFANGMILGTEYSHNAIRKLL